MQEEREIVHREPRRLWLVRHGATLWNKEQRFCGHSDIPLSHEGRLQARWLARQLRSQHVVAMYSSDLLRASQTAEIIAVQAPFSVEIETFPAWRELAFGDWEGLTYEQIVQQFPAQLAFFSNPVTTAPPGGESLTGLYQRVHNAFLNIVRASIDMQEGDIVLVSHGGPLRVLLCSILSMPQEQQWRLRIEHGSLSAIDFLPVIDDTMPVATLASFNIHVSTLQRVRKE